MEDYSIQAPKLPRIQVHPSRRFLQTEGGQPFFWLADTAWELFHRLTREEATQYLENRRRKGFNLIQAVALAEIEGLTKPNAYGQFPLANADPAHPTTFQGGSDYWSHMDFIIRLAASKGMYVGLLPTWADKVNPMWNGGPAIFTQQNAQSYGKFLGSRYKDDTNVVWILGGDRPPLGADFDVRDIWRAMVKGITEGCGSKPLMTFHTFGGHSSSEYWQNDGWLDMNMWQSGHAQLDTPNWEMIATDYALQPARPVLDAEPNYEDHHINFDMKNPLFNQYDVRKAAYRAVFAGACGHTYGHHAIWRMYKPQDGELGYWPLYWNQALDRPGAYQMLHLRRLIESRPFFTRIPGQDVLVGDTGKAGNHVQCAGSSDGSYAFIYIPTAGQQVGVDLDKINGDRVTAWWFDPRTGDSTRLGEGPGTGKFAIKSPPTGPDWVLVLDETSRNYPPPGSTP